MSPIRDLSASHEDYIMQLLLCHGRACKVCDFVFPSGGLGLFTSHVYYFGACIEMTQFDFASTVSLKQT